MVTCKEKADLLALLYGIFSCVFVTFSYGILCQVRYLIVSIPVLCLLPYFLSSIYTEYLMNATSPTLLVVFLKFCGCFCQDLKLCMPFDCNPQIIFDTFFAV